MVEVGDIVREAASPDLERRHAAFSTIVTHFQDMAYGCAYGILGDTHRAQDVAQEAFLIAYRDVAKVRDPSAFPGWFKQIVMHTAYRDSKRNSRVVTSEDFERDLVSDAPSSESEVIASESKLIVRTAIAQLPEHERIVTVLHYLTGYSQNRIAEFLDLPLSTVKKRMQRARERLKGRMEIVEKSLKDQKPSQNEDFASQLMDTIHAAESGDITKLATLLEQNPELAKARNERPSDSGYYSPGASALHYAAWCGQKEIAELLLDYGADLDMIDKTHNASPIGWANENDQPEMVDFFVRRGAKLNFRQAAMCNRLDVIEKMLNEDRSILAFQDRQGTALHAACAWGRIELAKYLLGQGIDVNTPATQKQDVTPLHRAAQAGQVDSVKLLLEHGANREATREDGKTALDLAEWKGHDEVVRLLSN